MVYYHKSIDKRFNTQTRATSGYRCKKHNTAVGGSKRSHHMTDAEAGREGTNGATAIDFTHSDRSMLKQIAEYLDMHWIGGFCFYEKANFIHIDLGRRRRWTEK